MFEWCQKLKKYLFNYEWESILNDEIKKMLLDCIDEIMKMLLDCIDGWTRV